MNSDENEIYGAKLKPQVRKWIYDTLLPLLEKTTIQLSSNRKNSGHGRSQSFGYGNTRKTGFTNFKNNAKYPELYKMLLHLGKQIVPKEIPFTSVVVNHNYQTKKHIDKNNIGYSLTLSFGNFTGGELVIDGDKYQTKDNPIIFNGALNEHYNQPIQGQRYSLVYFAQAPNKLKTPEQIQQLHEQIVKYGMIK